MNVDVVKDLSGDVFKMILILSGPALLVSLVVGLSVSIFQAVTQIQEFTLTFVPKIVAVFLCIYLLFPWTSRMMIGYTTELITKIPVYIK